MSRQIKLIWDFRGPNAEKTAEHHEIHLRDFIKMNAMEGHITGVEPVNEFHHIAFLVVEESQMKDLRDRLKPHRGQVYTPKT
ncbi:hypothetical protein [Psychroflexus montanilacus]|uniref:hypothetical protein n=1 Tax=Psychroflexus montanilacus TaxID=2873598 RepID=UPI001CCCD40B|nr:hypothetical protein [Psychroflexus montanilacus]MBZ9651587.1 hypothetical protein [Psychroflexus montanilacus]